MSDSENHFSGSADESSKPGLLAKKKKKSEKPGYRMFEADDSDDGPVVYDDSVRTATTKLKKHGRPSFKFSGKIKLKEKEKDDKKDSSDKKEEKEARKSHMKKFKDKDSKDKESKEHKTRKKRGFSRKPPLAAVPSINTEAETPVFGVALSLAVERTPSHDGVILPVIVRECIDYIEEHGMLYEGIYRISGVKSKVQMLKDAYNRQQPAYLFEHDPSIVASLLKQFLRELPETLLTSELAAKFEEASVMKTNQERLESLKHCIDILPPCNKELLSWMIVHMNHIIAKEKINKMNIQNVSIVLSPTMRISHRVLNLLFLHSDQLFSHVQIIRYKPPLPSAASKWSVDLPETAEAIEEELNKQESLLTKLHQELSHTHHSKISDKEDKVWEVQRTVTQLKRKLKLISKTKAARQLEKEQLSSDHVQRADPNRRSINAAELNFALQTGSLRRANRASQAELASASSCASFTASTEALMGQNKSHVTVESGASVSSQPKRTSITSVTLTSNGKHDAAEDDRKTPTLPQTDLELSAPQSDATELSNEVNRSSSESLDLSEAEHLSEEKTVEYSDTVTNADDDDVKAPQKDLEQPTVAEGSGVACDLPEYVGAMKVSTSQDSDVTLSPYTAEGVSESTSQQSLSDARPVVSSDIPTTAVTSDIPTTAVTSDIPTTAVTSDIPTTAVTSDLPTAEVATENEEPPKTVEEQMVHEVPLADRPEINQLETIEEPAVIQSQVTEQASDPPVESVTNPPAILLIPEKLHAGSDNHNSNLLSETSDQVYNIADDDELRLLIAEEAQLIWEEEELIAIKDELRRKIDTEIIEIERLKEEIMEYEELRSITTLGQSSETGSSDEYYSSTSDTEPEDDAAAQTELDNLVMTLHELTQQNDEYETTNTEMVKKIHEERMGCVNVKIQIRLLQQQMLGSQAEEYSLI